jgi:hypothetical protein
MNREAQDSPGNFAYPAPKATSPGDDCTRGERGDLNAIALEPAFTLPGAAKDLPHTEDFGLEPSPALDWTSRDFEPPEA